jgi:hypothetical protein
MKLPWHDSKPQCQVVIKLPPEETENFDRMAECELKLSRLLKHGEVDLREVGGGVVNLFILTSEPEECVQEALAHLSKMQVKPVAVGYRASREQEFVRLWPENDSSPLELR